MKHTFPGGAGIETAQAQCDFYYPERRTPSTSCVVCGGKPVLRVVGDEGFCCRHEAEAFAAARRAKVGV